MIEQVTDQPEVWTHVRDALLEEFSDKNLDGLDTDRVYDYLDAQDLDTKPVLVVTYNDLDKLRRIDKFKAFSDIVTFNDVDGTFSPSLGLSIVIRNPMLEEQNGVSYTESFMVHEAAHSSSNMTIFTRDQDTGLYGIARMGFSTPSLPLKSGMLYEEGWADLQRGNYIKQHYSNSTLSNIKTKTGMEPGKLDDLVYLDFGGRMTPMPFKYIKFNERGSLGIKRSSAAAYAVELLMQQDPAIYSAMHRARTDIAGLRDFAQKVDSISPGIYMDLRAYDYSEAGFLYGLHAAIDRLTDERPIRHSPPNINF